MSDYATALAEAANSWSSAYLQFETGRSREGFRSYAFVEDEDDKSFYQIALSQVDSICYLGCGGKTGVTSVFKKLTTESRADGNLFFVDRDTEREPFTYGDEILRTSFYSWESHVCEPSYVGWFLQRRLEPNLSPADVNEITSGWISTLEAFKPILAKHTALCRTASVLEISLGMSKVIFTADADKTHLSLKPGPKALSWHNNKVNLAVANGATKEDIERRDAFYSSTHPVHSARGKHLFILLRTFVESAINHLGREARGQINSAKTWMEAMPWTQSSIAYVREYASKRLETIKTV